MMAIILQYLMSWKEFFMTVFVVWVNLLIYKYYGKIFRFFWKEETKKPDVENKNIPPKRNTGKMTVVGETRTVFIGELPKVGGEPEPVYSEPLETESVVEEEDDIDPEDVDVSIAEKSVREIIEEDDPDYFSHEGEAPSEDFSSGVTFEQLSHAVDVVNKKKTTEQDLEMAVNTLFEVRETDLFQFIASQAESLIFVETMMNDFMNKKSSLISNNGFDMSKYI